MDGPSFFEKNVAAGRAVVGADRAVPTSGSRDGSGQDDTLVFPVVDDLATLTWLANLAALELHAHQWRVGEDGRPLRADRLVVDLDPGEPAGLASAARSRCGSATPSPSTTWWRGRCSAAARACTSTPTCPVPGPATR